MSPLVMAGLTLGATGTEPPSLPPDAGRFTTKITRTYSLNYLVSLPDGYAENPRKRYPLILFLHGSGERGTDVNQVRLHGPFKELAKGLRIPAIVVAPQCPSDTWWQPDVLSALLKQLERTYRVDRDRITLTGLSMGGYGTWAWADLEPHRFAAIAPICGGGDPAIAPRIAHLPTWVVHGTADPAVPFAQSDNLVKALRQAGGTPRFDVIDGGGHDVWTAVYENPAFYEWLLAQRRARK